MDVHIGSKIAEVAKKKGISPTQMGTMLGTSVRNIHNIYNSTDILTSRLTRISEILEFNFFELFHPVTVPKNGIGEPEEKVPYKKSDRMLTAKFEVQYPISLSDQLGKFMMHVHMTAEKMGYRML